jgi:hypothetical protein
VTPGRIAPAASSDPQEAEIPSSARLRSYEALERLPYGRRDRLLAPAGNRAQVPLHPFVEKNRSPLHMPYASIQRRRGRPPSDPHSVLSPYAFEQATNRRVPPPSAP